MTPDGQKRGPSLRLSAMMFLQYAVWGLWLPYLASYLVAPVAEGGLGFSWSQVGWILGLAGSIGAVTAPFLAGQVADRFMNAERYLGLLLIIGGVIKYATYYAHDYASFLVLSMAYSVFYSPTLALTNSIAFAHLSNPEKHFPPVRVWGTIGWIVASSAFTLLWLQSGLSFTWYPPFLEGTPKENSAALVADCLRVSGVVAVLYGVWAMVALPATPPRRNAENPLAFAKAFGLLRHPGFLVATLAALPISMIHQVYFFRTSAFLESLGFPLANVGPIMSIGQIAEIVFLAGLGFFLARLDYRKVLAIGCFAFFVRYGVFAIATPETRLVVPVAMVLHGVCYAWFFAAAWIYVERVAPADVRHSAQTVFGIIILGLGPILAGVYNGWLDALAKPGPESPLSWPTVWWVQAFVGLGAGLLVLMAFRPGLEPRRSAPERGS